MPDEQPQAIGLAKEQKIGLTLLLIFTFIAIALGFLQIRNTMYGPFAMNKEVPSSIKDQVNTPEALNYRDTDFDGLNDFEELYVYSTSPYLADTDSDGINDKQEIEQGKNPACAEGKDCGGVESGEGVISSTSSLNLGVADPGAAPADLTQMLSDPKQVREMLKGVGVEASVLSKISDADLMKLVEEVMMSTTTGQAQALGGLLATTTTQ